MLRNASTSRATRLLAACLFGVVTLSASAAPPVDTRFTYQGRLSEDGVLGNGQFDFFFSVFDVNSGGAPLATWVVNDLQVTNGLFQTEINFPAAVYNGTKRWLQVEVRPGASAGAFSILGNRQELLAVPFATRTLIPDSLQSVYDTGHAVATGTGPIALQAPLDYNVAPGLADAIHVTQGQIRVGNLPAGGRGQIMLENSTVANSITAYLGTAFAGPGVGDSLVGWRQAGNNSTSFFTPNFEFYIGPSISGAGGMLNLASTNTGDTNISLDGNNGSPFLSLNGAANFVRLDPQNATPNNKVQVPSDSIWSPEIGDEPGVASNGDGVGAVGFSGTFTVLTSRTITCPGPGYVLALATAQVNITHTVGTSDNFDLGISPFSNSLPSNQDVAMVIPASYPTGSLILPGTVHGLFPVSAGATTFFFLNNLRTGSGSSVNDTQLTLVYFPTAYGSVNPTTLLAGPPDDLRYRRAGMAIDDIQAEQRSSISANMSRMEREMEDMKRQLAELRQAKQAAPVPSMQSTAK